MYSYDTPGFTEGPFFSLLFLLCFLAVPIAFGFITSRLAMRKGYMKPNGGRRYFWTGFFLMIAGLLYVGFLPEEEKQYTLKLEKALRATKPNQEGSEQST